MKTQLLKDLAIVLMNAGNSNLTLEDDVLDVNSIATVTIEKKKEIALSFEVRTNPTYSSSLTKLIIEFCIEFYKDYKVEIYETYALVIDEDDTVKEVLFGEEALEYFYRSADEDEVEKKIDHEKEVDSLLDKINKNGINSLSNEQKKFLNDFSKRKSK